MWGVCVAGEGGTKENKLLVSSRKDQRRNLKTSVVFHSTCDVSAEHVTYSMHAAALEYVGVCFLSKALGGGLAGEVTPYQKSFEGKGAEDIWYLRSQVNFPSYFFLLGCAK